MSKFDASYWEGVVIAQIMERAMEKAYKDNKGVISRETINRALESFKNEDFGGLMPKVTYSKTNHGASFTARMVRVKEDGSYIPLTNFFNPEKDKIKLLK